MEEMSEGKSITRDRKSTALDKILAEAKLIYECWYNCTIPYVTKPHTIGVAEVCFDHYFIVKCVVYFIEESIYRKVEERQRKIQLSFAKVHTRGTVWHVSFVPEKLRG